MSFKSIKEKSLFSSFLISFFYVGIGTINTLTIKIESSDWRVLLDLITLPVTLFSKGLMYTEKNYMPWVIFIQIIIFFVLWFIIYRWLFKSYSLKEENKKQN